MEDRYCWKNIHSKYVVMVYLLTIRISTKAVCYIAGNSLNALTTLERLELSGNRINSFRVGLSGASGELLPGGIKETLRMSLKALTDNFALRCFCFDGMS